MKKVFFLTSCLALLVMGGCTQTPGSEISTGPTTIKIGVIAPLSEGAASYGQDAVNTYTMAVDAYNASHTGTKFELVVEDGKCDGKNANSAAQKLVNIDQVKVIIGGVCSSETIAAAKVAQPAGVVVLSPTASSPDISDMGTGVYRFYNDTNQAKAIAQYLKKNNITDIALVYESTDYAAALTKTLKKDYDGTLSVDEKFSTDEKDLSLLAKKIASHKDTIQMIIYVTSSDSNAIALVHALDAQGLTKDFAGKILTSEAGMSNSVISGLSGKAESILTAQMPDASVFGSATMDFVKEFEAQHKINLTPTFIALFKEAVEVVMDASTDPAYGIDKLNDYMLAMDKTHPRIGAFGSYYMDGVDAIGLDFVIKQVKDGKIVDL